MSTQAQQTTSGQTTLAFEIGLLLLLALIWGSSFTLIKVAIPSIPPFTMVAARVTIAAILLLLIARAQGHALPRRGSVWAAFLVQGLLQSALPFTLISWGETHIASGLAGVLNATPPMFVLAIALTTGRGRQTVSGRKIIGVALGLAGVAVTMGADALSGIGTTAPLAQAAVLCASLCYAVAPIWGQRFSGLPAIVTAAGAMSCAAVLMLPAAAVLERPWTLAPPPAQAIAAVIALAVICTAFAMVIYFRLIHTLGPLGTTSGSYLRAGFAVALGTAWLGERFSWSSLAGMALILAGVVAVTVPAPARTGKTATGAPSRN
ncbi:MULTISPECIES: DMT family transporter [Bradyrhizobium]|uniref:Blr8172 protein n=1 Tax=Bradyrhizobium diazoefficiens (strain JCM 10833 / BCRC 13528 / IAM 13628 / NBRC 14792 / USDA 110) TaxID=224911 RepID=Q89BI0_BRADU|nr:EamA family transporter [Bradyrhizobium diazoefficiens]MBP1061500.1 drug/metabolite transporter (DMT)-like permease [Bradyrhizobium japonicum]AND93003.1 permease [Bradyrhizobium diazoefficiens USDA 110]AWO94849.1 EamA family transporter [Bradyrhizobium diazoefficiens]PDT56474.1 EamA family transporter [Bradyrhizobium diazoefficiens]QBP26897.1 EamA family transporter [Bradyrhizobium diazoefficiens]